MTDWLTVPHLVHERVVEDNAAAVAPGAHLVTHPDPDAIETAQPEMYAKPRVGEAGVRRHMRAWLHD